MNKIQTLIHTIVEAADTCQIAILQKYLHPEFRVVANRFGNNETQVLTKKRYLDLLKNSRIGREKRTIKIDEIDVQNHIAVAKATLTGSRTVFTSFYQFVKNPKGEWQLINDLPLLSAK